MAINKKSISKKRPKAKSPKGKKADAKKMGKIKHIKTVVDGITFDSKMESEYYLVLKELKEQGIVKNFSLQPEYLLQDKFIIVDGQIIYGSDKNFNKIKRKTKANTIQAIKYKSDFLVEYSDGSVRVVDTKGIETADFKIKKKMFMCKYPHLILDVIIYDKQDGWIDYSVYQKKINEIKRNKKVSERKAS